MAHFVLVHGAWHGAWCWRDVVQGLTQAGHRVHAVTLTGVGERAHLLNADITLQTHIEDVVQAIECEELDEVVLVVHSYAGMIGTGVADRMAPRLRHLVYLDAVVPSPAKPGVPRTHGPHAKPAWPRPRPRPPTVLRRRPLLFLVCQVSKRLG